MNLTLCAWADFEERQRFSTNISADQLKEWADKVHETKKLRCRTRGKKEWNLQK